MMDNRPQPRPIQYQERTFRVDVNADAPNVNNELGFFAYTIRVDNPTGQWLFIPAAQQWIMPYTVNVVLRVQGTQQAVVECSTPAGQVSSLFPGELAIVTFSEWYAPPSSGNRIDESTPLRTGFAIVPNDATDLTRVTRAIYVGGTGTLVFRPAGNLSSAPAITLINIADGVLLPIRASRVLSTGTTATNLIGFA